MTLSSSHTTDSPSTTHADRIFETRYRTSGMSELRASLEQSTLSAKRSATPPLAPAEGLVDPRTSISALRRENSMCWSSLLDRATCASLRHFRFGWAQSLCGTALTSTAPACLPSSVAYAPASDQHACMKTRKLGPLTCRAHKHAPSSRHVLLLGSGRSSRYRVCERDTENVGLRLASGDTSTHAASSVARMPIHSPRAAARCSFS